MRGALVAVGIVATALWLIRRDGELGRHAAPETDQGAIELDVRAAVELGRARARAAAETKARRGPRTQKTASTTLIAKQLTKRPTQPMKKRTKPPTKPRAGKPSAT